MKGNEMKKYRKNLEVSQQDLGEMSNLAQNTVSQYEREQRLMDINTSEHLSFHLRVVDIPQKVQLTNNLVRTISKSILEEGALDYWASEIKAQPEQYDSDILLNGGKILIRCFNDKALSVVGNDFVELKLENLFLGFQQWITRSTDFLKEQIVLTEDKEIISIDEIAVSEIVQYAFFDNLLCDL